MSYGKQKRGNVWLDSYSGMKLSTQKEKSPKKSWSIQIQNFSVICSFQWSGGTKSAAVELGCNKKKLFDPVTNPKMDEASPPPKLPEYRGCAVKTAATYTKYLESL